MRIWPFALLAACSEGAGSPVDLGSCEIVERHGEGTYYAADGSGNCSFDPAPGRVVAMNTTDYAGSAICGACIEVSGPKGTIRALVVDRCPGCAAGDIDLSEEAFAAIAEVSAGRVPVTWHIVPCEVLRWLEFRFKEGSNEFWAAIQVRNHRHPIARLEVKVGDGFRELERQDYNYFVGEGLGPGPFHLRVSDAVGNVVEEPSIPLGDGVIRSGTQQFPRCP